MAPQPIPKSLASPGLLAHVAVSKYQDALPLYRQEQILERIGVELPRATLANWMIRAGTLIQPLVNLLRDQLLGYDMIQMDETTVQVLKEPGKARRSRSRTCGCSVAGHRIGRWCCSTMIRRAAARCRNACWPAIRATCRATAMRGITRWLPVMPSLLSAAWPTRGGASPMR
jgi:hypothetical protein